MKIVLFGIGKIFEEIKSQIDFHNVVGLIDNEYSKLYQKISGIAVVQPERINEYEYDYVVICNTGYFEEMRKQLIELGIPTSQIIGWQYYLYILKYGTKALSRNEFESIANVLCKLEVQSVLDVECGVEENAFYVGTTKLTERVRNIRIYSSEEKFNPNIYIESGKDVEQMDAILFLDFFLNHTVHEFVTRVEQIKDKTKYIIASIPYPACDEWSAWTNVDFDQFGEITWVNGRVVKLLVIKLQFKSDDTDNRMYVVSHKDFVPPKNTFYSPIYVGGYEPKSVHGYRDSVGDNISQLNAKINELTAVYWVWKNQYSKNVGFCHYRRYFGTNSPVENPYFDLMTKEQAEYCLDDVDMIVSNAICTYPRSVSGQLKDTLNETAYTKCYNLYVSRIKEICPDYLTTFESVMNGMVMYPCNMFFTNWKNFDAYCSWLFPIIIDVASGMDVSVYDSYSRRVVGFFAERMLTVWIVHNHIRVKEIDVINI